MAMMYSASHRRKRRIRIVGEPRNEVRALRDFVGNPAVGALILAQKIQRDASAAEIALSIECE